MKKVQFCYTIKEFEDWINREDIEVLQVDVKVVEQSYLFQDSFAGIIFYKELNK